jgi:hypothetical protein
MTDATCSKCEGVLDTDGYPKWCKACRAKHRREYEATKKEMGETRGYAAGCSAMREFLADYFKSLGNAHVSGFEASVLVGRAGVPR